MWKASACGAGQGQHAGVEQVQDGVACVCWPYGPRDRAYTMQETIQSARAQLACALGAKRHACSLPDTNPNHHAACRTHICAERC